MSELVNQYEQLKEEHEKELLFVDTMLKEQNYKSQIKRINNNKALPILNHVNGNEHYFILVKPNMRSQFIEEQFLDFDVVNLIFSIEEFIEEDYIFSKQCKNAIQDKTIKTLCSELIEQMQLEVDQKHQIERWKEEGATVDETEIDGFYTINFNKRNEV
ncbi:hypothetical protein L7E35_004674 [Vibrio parahaemolyticus]|nr:hypothetical protein [Vibrio parahaemolyticus]EIV1599728.1 hypothetical protein [Vibrio parahaemolyticus]